MIDRNKLINGLVELGSRSNSDDMKFLSEVAQALQETPLDCLLQRPYTPPPLFIFEEVELGGSYHKLHAHRVGPESDWSEPYTKSGTVRYRSRVVRVDYPPKEFL